MKLVWSAVKTFKENLRDWKVLILVLFFAPFFIFLMYLFYASAGTTYKIGITNSDSGSMAEELAETLSNLKGFDDDTTFKVVYFEDQARLKAEVKEKTIDLGIEIPEGYSKKLADKANGSSNETAAVNFYGSMGNLNYTVAAILASDAVNKQGMTVARITLPSEIKETFLEKKQSLNGFDTYVPGGIALAVLMILFTASAAIVKENDKKTLLRLKLSRLGSFNFLAGVSIVQALLGTAAILLSFGAALALGYKPVGGIGAVVVVGLLSSLSIVAVSLVVASFLNTIFDVLTIGCFPFFVFAFFTGCMFPLPKTSGLSFFGHAFGITDLLPLTHTVNAFNKIMNDGAGISGVGYEILMIIALTILYFLIGLALYRKRKLSKA